MTKQSWSAKKKATLAVVLAAAVIGTSAGGYALFRPDPPPEVSYGKVTTGSITQTLEMSGVVESANQGTFPIVSEVKVKTVNVRVGDRIKKGDLLATFDTSSLDSLVADKQKAYNKARDSYNKAMDAERKAAQQANKPKPAATTATAKKPTAAATTPSTTTPQNLVQTLYRMVRQGVLAMDDVAKILNRLANGESLLGMPGISEDILKDIVGNVEIGDVISNIDVNSVLPEITNMLGLSDTLKATMESAKKNLDNTKAIVNTLKTGWKAKKDGIVREINITAGEIYVNEKASTGASSLDMSAIIGMITGGGDASSALTGMLGSMTGSGQQVYGMVLEYYPYAASFTLNKNDVLKIELDQEATIKTQAGNTLTGAVTYIAPVAEGGGGINDMVGSIIGGGSSTSSGGVAAKVSIPKPDESVIIGLDVSISIKIAEKESAVLIPAEALKFDDKGKFVWVYDEEEKTAKRVDITVGLSSVTMFEILSGVQEGQTVLKTVPQNMKEGDRVTLKADTKK